MRTTETNLEPILLVHEGTDRLRELIADAATGSPVADFVALDGSCAPALGRHRRPTCSTRSRAELAGDPGADRRRAPPLRGLPAAAGGAARPGRPRTATRRGTTASPCSSTSATTRCSSGRSTARVGALTMSDLQDISADRGDDFETLPGPGGRVRRLRRTPAGRRLRLVRGLRRAGLGRAADRAHQPGDAAVLHEVLLPAWGVAEEQIGYHHSLDQALHTTARQPRHRGGGAPADGGGGDGERPRAASGCPASRRRSLPSRAWAW